MKVHITVLAVATLLVISLVQADFPKEPFISHLLVSRGETVKLEDGVDLSNKYLSNVGPRFSPVEIHRHGDVLRDVNFSNCYLHSASFLETVFVNCNFAGANLTSATFDMGAPGSNFTDSHIRGANIGLDAGQLKSTPVTRINHWKALILSRMLRLRIIPVWIFPVLI